MLKRVAVAVAVAVAVSPLLIALLFILPLYSAPLSQLTFPPIGTVNSRANIRSGPATTNAVVDIAVTGQAINIIGCNADCSWYQIGTNRWIAAFLVELGSSNCDPSYPGVCIPPAPPDLNCGDLPVSDFQVIGSDPHNFDADDDGIGCEGDNDTSQAPTANGNARLHSGPGTSYRASGRAAVGQALELTGRNAASTWYQLSSGAWIAAILVNNAPADLPPVTDGPTATSTTTPTATPVIELTATSTPTPTPTKVCDPNYLGACIPPYPPDIDCGQISERRFQVIGSDPHGFDGDSDGIGCEGD